MQSGAGWQLQTFFEMIRKIVLALVAVVVVLAFIGFFLPREVSVTQKGMVHAPADYVFDDFNNLKNWQSWNYWNAQDPAMTVTYGDVVEGVGAAYAWNGTVNGSGTIRITESKPDERVTTAIDFGGNAAKGIYSLVSWGDSTQVTMTLTADLGSNPIGRWIGIFMQMEIDKAFTYSLEKLEHTNASKPRFSIPIAVIETAGFSYTGIRQSMNPKDPDAIGAQTSGMFRKLFTDLQRAHVEMAGPPFCLYPRFTPEAMDVVCAVPVVPTAKLPAAYTIEPFAGGLAARAIHVGSYRALQSTHDQLIKYIPFKGYTEAGPPWEVYLTDPDLEKDTAKWVTEVYYPVRKR